MLVEAETQRFDPDNPIDGGLVRFLSRRLPLTGLSGKSQILDEQYNPVPNSLFKISVTLV